MFGQVTGGLTGSPRYSPHSQETLVAECLKDLNLQKGVGSVTFTRNSAQYSLDATGALVAKSANVAAFDLFTGNGLLIEPATTNKCTYYGVPRADAYGSTLTTGTATKGKVYEIVTRTSVDWGTVGTLLSGTANTVGAKYVITGALTFTANDTGKEAIDYVGTKAYHDGTVFQNPITGMTLSGDVAAVLSIVTNQTAIDAAKLGGIVNGYKVYKSDNSAGASAVFVAVATSGVLAVTTAISLYCFATMNSSGNMLRPSGGTEGSTQIPYGTTFTRKSVVLLLTAARNLEIRVEPGSIVYFLVPQLEELPYATSLAPSAGATATRAAVVTSIPMAGNFPASGIRHIQLQWTPTGITTGQCLWSSRQDANNYVAVWANGTTSVSFEKKVAGASEATTLTMTPVVGTTYTVDAYINAYNTLQLKVNGTAAGTNTSTTLAPVLGTTMEIGSLGGVSQCCGTIKQVKVLNA